jgi:predicted O-linked N-acetylglucosamine transferase (SPINDLY family)
MRTKLKNLPKGKSAQGALVVKAHAQFQQAVVLHQQGRLQEASQIYEGLLQVDPKHFDALHMLGVMAYQTKNYEIAVDLIGKAISINSNNPAAYSNQGAALKELGQLQAAIASYDKAISLQPNYAEAYNNKGVALAELKQFSVAVTSYDKAISLKPDYAEAHYNRGVALTELGQISDAVASYDKAISLEPDSSEAYNNRGNVLLGMGQFSSAVASYDKAISLKPEDAAAHNNKGAALRELGQFRAALASCEKAISLQPEYAEAYNNRGLALKELGQLEDAIASYDKAVSLHPAFAQAQCNRGNLLSELKHFNSALDAYDKAISLKPDYAEAHYNRGVALTELGQISDAVASYDKAISLQPEYAEAYNNRGSVFLGMRQFSAALISYERAYSIQPELVYLLGALIHARMQLCVWDKLQSSVDELVDKVQSNEKVVEAFVALSLTDSREVHRKAAEIYVQDKHPANTQPLWSGQRYEHPRIRVAYVSCDFKVHPAALNNIGVWERHDRDRFEVIAVSYGPVHQEDSTTQGQLRTRLVKAFDRFLDVGDKSDEQIASLIRELEVDIAVDISGTMGDARQGILSHRPAPVQVNLYGYLSGAPYMDYIVSDRVVIPPEHEGGYTEKVVCLPYSWFSSDTSRQVSERQFTRGELGLPEEGVVYCSFNNAYKINPQMFDVWMRILLQVPGSVLWLQGGGQEKVKENLSKEASARGVDPTRLVFAHKIDSMADHLARHRAADVFLDTLPFNAQTTAVDALWAGLPVLTCLGQGSFGRVAGSVLMALGMEELVTKGWQEYEAQAVRIGLESGYAKSLKDKLERNRVDAPMFDTQRLTRHMESAYEQMQERVRQGLGPQGFEVQASYAD